MPRFYFDVATGDDVLADNEGTELSDLTSARIEAISDARYLMSVAILTGQDVSHKRIQVRDERGELVLRVPFTDAIQRPG